MSVCPKCGASVSMYDTGGTPWYACGSKGTFRSKSCVDREPVATQLREAQQRIKRLKEALDLVRPHCSFVHHSKKHQHAYDEPCPVVALIENAKEDKL